jgi:heme exporter protein B
VKLLRHAAVIAAKDIRIEIRGRHATSTLLPFAATLLVSFGFAFGPGRAELERQAPGLLWIAVLFGSVMAARRAFQMESEDGALEGLLLAPVDKAAVYLGKTAAVALQLAVLVVATLVLVVALFDLALTNILPIAAAFALGTIGLAAMAGLLGILADAERTREAVLPLLVLPLVAPVLIAGVRAVSASTDPATSGDVVPWLGLLVAFDVVFVSLGVLVFGFLMED